MPLLHLQDQYGKDYVKWGISGHPYYYNRYIPQSYNEALSKVKAQQGAIEASKHRNI